MVLIVLGRVVLEMVLVLPAHVSGVHDGGTWCVCLYVCVKTCVQYFFRVVLVVAGNGTN